MFTDKLLNNNLQLYTKSSIVAGTFLGGPMAAGIMIALNLNAIGFRQKARLSVIMGVAGNILLYALFMLLPENFMDRFPHFLIPVIYTLFTYIFIEVFHHDDLQTAFIDGAGQRSFYNSLLWGLLGLALSSIVILSFLNFKYYNYNTFAFGNNENELFYEKNIPDDDVYIIAGCLETDSYFNGDTSRDLYLLKNGSRYKLLILMDDDKLFKPEVNMDFRLLESVINRSGINTTLEIYLADQYKDSEYRIN